MSDARVEARAVQQFLQVEARETRRWLSERPLIMPCRNSRQQPPCAAFAKRKDEHQSPPSRDNMSDSSCEIGVKLHIGEHDLLSIFPTAPPNAGRTPHHALWPVAASDEITCDGLKSRLRPQGCHCVLEPVP